MGNYRSNLFSLCKFLGKSNLTKNIEDMILNFEKSEDFFSKSAWFSMTRDEQNHFYGVLLSISESTGKSGMISNIPILNIEELILCKRGNDLLNRVSNALINELSFLPSQIRESLNPYVNLRKIDSKFYDSIKTNSIDAIDTSALSQNFKESYMVESLKNQLAQMNINFLQNIQLNNMLEIYEIFNENEIKYGYDKIPENLSRIKENKLQGNITNEDKIEYFLFSLYVIKDIIEITLNTLYSALVGKSLPLLTNDNLIAINGPTTNQLFRIYEFSKVSKNKEKSFPRIANLCLVNANRNSNEDSLLKCIVLIVSMTQSFTGNFGSTTTLKGLEVDENLNRYYRFF
nr:hypothetical protein G8766_01515 [Lactococcus garvieae]